MIKTWEQRIPARLPESMIDCAMMQISCMAAEINELRAELGDLPQAQAEMLTDIKRLKAEINSLTCQALDIAVERDDLRLAAQAGLELLKMCQLYGPALAYGNTDIPTAITQLQAAMKEKS
jgi:septal ring factor EnvC (AmiA/AmiB activator)